MKKWNCEIKMRRIFLIYSVILFFVIFSLCISCDSVAADAADTLQEESSDRAKKNTGRFIIGAKAVKNNAAECTDVNMSVENTGADIKATVKLNISKGDYEESQSYETDISLPSGSRKEFVFRIPDPVLNDYNNRAFKVKVRVFSGSRLLQETEFKPSSVFPLVTSDEIMTGILSDDPGKLYWLDNGGKTLYVDGREQTVLLADIPLDFKDDDLASLKYLVIDNLDTAFLSDDQIMAISDWVSTGGALIIGTGQRIETVSGFDKTFLDADVPGKSDIPGGLAIIDYGSSYIDLLGDNTYMLREYGNGAILLLKTGLSEMKVEHSGAPDGDDSVENVMGSELASYILHNIFAVPADYISVTNSNQTGFHNSYDILNVFDYIEPNIRLHFGLIRIIVLLYCVISCPLLYLVLKKLGKRESIWIFLPAIALVFVVLIFFAGASNRMTGMHLTAVSIAEAGGRGNVHTYISGYHSTNKSWDFGLEDRYYAAGVLGSDRYVNDGEETSIIRQGENLEVKIIPHGSFDRYIIDTTAKNDNKGSITFSPDGAGYDATGILTNNSGHDLYFCAVPYNNHVTIFRNIKNGESVSSDDLTHVEKKNVIMDTTDYLNSYQSDMYFDKRYEDARHMAALYLACMDVSEGEMFEDIVAVTTDTRPFLKKANGDESMLCLYSGIPNR